MRLTVNSQESLQRAIGTLREQYKAHPFMRIQVKSGADRSLDQNAISHAWYEQISRELAEDSPEGVKRECKLHYGVPILRAEDDDFREQYDRIIKGRFTYAEKLEIMDWLPVTSLMTTKQMTRYLEAVQEGYRGRVALEFPEGA